MATGATGALGAVAGALRALLLCDGVLITLDHLPAPAARPLPAGGNGAVPR